MRRLLGDFCWTCLGYVGTFGVFVVLFLLHLLNWVTFRSIPAGRVCYLFLLVFASNWIALQFPLSTCLSRVALGLLPLKTLGWDPGDFRWGSWEPWQRFPRPLARTLDIFNGSGDLWQGYWRLLTASGNLGGFFRFFGVTVSPFKRPPKSLPIIFTKVSPKWQKVQTLFTKSGNELNQ